MTLSYTSAKPFEQFTEKVPKARGEGYKDVSIERLKLKGDSFYGNIVENEKNTKS